MTATLQADATRREFVAASVTMCAAIWLRPGIAASPGGGWTVFSAAEARDVDAITSQIIPSGDGPGAREAGVVRFIDAALGSWATDQRALVRQGILELTERARLLGYARFVDLPGDVQATELRRVENTAFFQAMRFATLAGMFCRPSRGGNFQEQGWRLIGYIDRQAWRPPFGYYDSESYEGSA